MQIFDSDVDEFAYARAGVEQHLNQESVPAGMSISRLDEAFDLGTIQAVHGPAAFLWRLKSECAASPFDDVLGLIVSQVILAPKLGGLVGDLPDRSRVLVLTANFRAVAGVLVGWHASAYAGNVRSMPILRTPLPQPSARFFMLSKFSVGLAEFQTYIRNNQDYIPNYGELYRQGETISTAFVESTINQVVSRRFAKLQQMHWTLRGAHLLLQTRTKVLNNELEEIFRRWYPLFHPQAQAA